jgi:hypothetical protein
MNTNTQEKMMNIETAVKQEVLDVVSQKKVGSFSLVPQSLRDAMELAKLIADSDLAPKDYRGKPGNVLVAVQMGLEVGLSPMTAIQSIAVINGKPSLYGDVGKAILLSKGFIIEEDDTHVIKKTGAGRCKITRPGHPPCERTFSIDNAKTAGLFGKQGPWTQYPERQLAWRAFWFAARDIASDVLKGLSGAEEVMDIGERDITPMGQPENIGLQSYPDDQFTKNLPTWTNLIVTGKKTGEQIIATVSSKGVLSEEKKKQILAIPVGGPPKVTFAQLEDRMRNAKDANMLDADADLIAAVGDPGQRTELVALYEQRKAELRP